MSATPAALTTLTALTLYRRHTQSCTKHYPQDQKVYRPVKQRDRAKDCECPIVAAGVLSKEGRIVNRSTKLNDWDTAENVAKQWEEWGQTTQPVETPVIVKNPTVAYAIEAFLASQGPQGRNVEVNTYHNFEILLLQRLKPYAEKHGITHVSVFNDLNCTTKFVESWVNLQPTRNRKDVEVPVEGVPLKDTTKKAELERFRGFLKYCVERGWLEKNCAKDLKFTARVEKKFGMSSVEEEFLFGAVQHWHDRGHGATKGDTQEFFAFCLVMRYAGLRISDATALNDSELVPRASGSGWAFRIYQQKTKEWVYIPIPALVAEQLQKLPFRGEKDGKRYWFWSTKGSLTTAINNWYVKVKKVVDEVGEKTPFTHKVSPHVFRHTFSIEHLNAGTDIKFVSRWLGHRSVSVTESHYAHAVHSTHVASDAAYDESMRRQEQRAGVA